MSHHKLGKTWRVNIILCSMNEWQTLNKFAEDSDKREEKIHVGSNLLQAEEMTNDDIIIIKTIE